MSDSEATHPGSWSVFILNTGGRVHRDMSLLSLSVVRFASSLLLQSLLLLLSALAEGQCEDQHWIS